MPDGMKFMQHMRYSGMPEDKVQAWASDAASRMQAAGYPGSTIRKYFGYREPDMAEVKGQVKANFAKITAQPEGSAEEASTKPTAKLPDMAGKTQVEAKDVWDAMKAGWEMSDVGLFTRGEMPDTVLGEHAGLVNNFAYTAAQMLGDLPAMVVGGAAGTLGGGGAGFAVGGFGGAAIGAELGGSAGAFAVPAGIRKALIDQYQKGDIKDAGDFASRVVDATWEAAKGAITGVATGGAKMLAGPLGSTAANLASEVTAQTVVSKALEGQLPDAEDFVNGAVAIGGLHAAGAAIGKATYTVDKFQRIYKAVGAPPEQVVETVNHDPTFKGQTLSENIDQPREVGPTALPEKQTEPVIMEEPKDGAPPPPPPYPPAVVGEESKLPAIREDAPPQPANSDDLLKRIADEPDPQKQSLKDWVNDGFSRLYAKHLDYTSVVADVMRKIGNEAITAKNAWVLMRLHAAVQDKIRESWEYGTRDFNTREINGEGGKAVLDAYVKATGDTSIDGFRKYMIAARTVELGTRGIKQFGVDRSDANSLDRQYLNANQHIAPFLDRMVQFQNRMLDYVGASGRYSQESIAAMKELNRRYVPFDKVFEPDKITGLTPFSSRDIKKIGDSDLQIRDPIVSILTNVGHMVRMAHETEAANAFAESLKEAHMVETDEKSLVPTSLIDTGMVGDQGAVMIEGNPFIERAPEQKGMMGESQIASYENGKRTLWNVNPEVAKAFKAMVGNKPALDMWTTMLKPFAQALRIGTVYNPLFGLRHAWRNQITSGTLSETGLKPFQSLLYSMDYFFGDKQKYHDFIDSGAAINSIDPLTKGYADGEIYRLAQKSGVEKAWNLVKTMGGLSHWMIVQNDNLIRYAEYSRSLEKGSSRVEAAFQARQVIPDFQKMGYEQSALRQVTAFLNVHAQGMARMGEAFREDLDNGLKAAGGDMKAAQALMTGYIAKNLAYITVPSVLLYLANKDDDAIQDLPDWQKNMYWNWHHDNWRKANSVAEALSVKSAYPSNVRDDGNGGYEVNDGTIFRIQKPFTNGIMFGSGFEAVLNSLEKNDPKAFKDFLKTVAGSTIAEPIPTAVNPILEHMVNRNFYTSQPIVRQSMENKLPEFQYDNYTSETAKALGRMLSYVPLIKDIGPQDAHMGSPKVIDNYIHAWGGTLGHYAIEAIDRGLEAAGIAQPKIRPTASLSDIPGVQEFVIRFPNARPQSISDFEDRYHNADQIYKTINELRKEGNLNEAADLSRRYAGSMDRLRGVDSAIRNANAAIQKLSAADMDATQKRQLMDTMMYQMASMAKMGNQYMDDFEKRANNRGK